MILSAMHQMSTSLEMNKMLSEGNHQDFNQNPILLYRQEYTVKQVTFNIQCE